MYVYGKNAVKEYLKKDRKIYKAFIWNEFNDTNIISDIQKKNIHIKIL